MRSDPHLLQGGRASSNTLHSNIAQRMGTFPTSDLLATQRDAICFAHILGIKYVWIDAICIIQDSTPDWSHEAALMHEYYGNAYFTLCIASENVRVL